MNESTAEVKILNVKILSFSFKHKDSLESIISKDSDANFIYNSNIGLKVNIESESLDIKHTLKISLPNESKEEIIKLEVLSTYLIKNLKQFEISSNEVDIPEEIVTTLVTTSISNLRGVLSVKAAETGFDHIILPLIDMSELTEKKKSKRKRD